MAKVTVTYEESKEMRELVQGTANIVKATKKALDDGWQPGTDIPVILTSAVAELAAMVQGMDQVGAEMKEDMAAWLRSIMNGGVEIASPWLPKQEADADA